MKRVKWKKNSVVNVKLKDNLYIIGQMLDSPVMCFFKYSSTDGKWPSLLLKKEDILFCVFVGNIVLERMCEKNDHISSIVPMTDFEPKHWIKPKLNFQGGFPFKGGDLIEIDFSSKKGASSSLVLKENIDISDPSLNTLELTTMWGDEDLKRRLINFFDSGVDVNEIKSKVFPY